MARSVNQKLIFILSLFWQAYASAYACPLGKGQTLIINTSNQNKQNEFKEYLSGCDIEWKNLELKEPEADALTVIQYKASQFIDNVLVDDASLEVKGVQIGVNVRWLLHELPNYSGREAFFKCLLGINKQDKIEIYQGLVTGTIVPKKGPGFGIGPFFLPDGAKQTLGEFMDPQFNPRYLALRKFIEGKPDFTLPLLTDWKGKFQNSD